MGSVTLTSAGSHEMALYVQRRCLMTRPNCLRGRGIPPAGHCFLVNSRLAVTCVTTRPRSALVDPVHRRLGRRGGAFRAGVGPGGDASPGGGQVLAVAPAAARAVL